MTSIVIHGENCIEIATEIIDLLSDRYTISQFVNKKVGIVTLHIEAQLPEKPPEKLEKEIEKVPETIPKSKLEAQKSAKSESDI